MDYSTPTRGRRSFLRDTLVLSSAVAGFTSLPKSLAAAGNFEGDDMNIIGPKKGYSPQIGTLVSMMTWMRAVVLMSVKGMTQADLDYLFDSKANTIGALLMHLAATETYYGLHTFQNKKWGSWDDSIKQKWDAAMNLGDAGRKAIKGNTPDFYLNLLNETREKTLAEFRKRDDNWLMSVDQKWGWGPTNNYCKWFHVCEHESNHNGQIKWLKSRLPGAKQGNE